MYIKNLKIKTPRKMIRNINFHKGLNLIIDETPVEITSKETGNNVGKTTVLKLIDLCLGGSVKNIYTSEEKEKNVYELVKKFLEKNNVTVILTLVDNLDEKDSNDLIIERNFLQRNKSVRKINSVNYPNDEEFQCGLRKLLFPDLKNTKPTLRQLIAHNIRYKDRAITNTLSYLDQNTKDVEYETLFLYMFGCSFDDGERKQKLYAKIDQETKFKDRLQKENTKNAYKASLELIQKEIKKLEEIQKSFNLNPNFNNDLESLNEVKYKISQTSSKITNLTIKKNLIEESKRKIDSEIVNCDIEELKTLYSEIKLLNVNINKNFEDMLDFHNKMVENKSKFITTELPVIVSKINIEKERLDELLKLEKTLTEATTKMNSIEELNRIISALNEKYTLKGQYENIISQIETAEENIEKYNLETDSISEKIYSKEFSEKLETNISDFNDIYSAISEQLYDEKYLLKYEKKILRKTHKPCYEFSTFASNFSTGKKQGEILAFDLAYIKFANIKNINSLNFILNDKKELMHHNQLLKLKEYSENNDTQIIFSILQDKLPDELNDDKYILLRLSQKHKLFDIENYSE